MSKRSEFLEGVELSVPCDEVCRRGGHDTVSGQIAMEHGDVFLLCCDGITDLIEDWMIREIMVSGETLDEVADNLVRAANANGGTDNITVVLIAIFASFDEPSNHGSKTMPGF